MLVFTVFSMFIIVLTQGNSALRQQTALSLCPVTNDLNPFTKLTSSCYKLNDRRGKTKNLGLLDPATITALMAIIALASLLSR